MKKFILLFAISFCFNIFVKAQGWRLAYNMPISSIGGGCVIDQNTAWLVGYSQGLYKTTDGGMNWIEKLHADPTSINANDVSFINALTGFVGCDHGHLLKTTDGGETWQQFNMPDTTYAITQLHFFDSNLGFVLSTSGKVGIIYKTTDGGTNWITTATISGSTAWYLYSMDFSSPTSGIVVGNSANLYYTTDGTNWNKAPNVTFPITINYSRTDQYSVKFISPTSAISCGWGSVALGFQPTIFLKTTDAGATWNYLEQADANKFYVNFKSLYFKDSLNGISVGGATYPGTVICRTTDGGSNWIPLPAVSGFNPSKIIGSGNRLIVSGDGGNIIVSNDFGDSWVMINKHPSSVLSSIKIVNNNIYSCGYGGVFFKSTDLGNTFSANPMVAANKCLWSKALQFLNENLGYAVSQYGQAIKTTDAGNSWTQIIRDTASSSVMNQALCFINESIGFVVGNISSNVDIIYKTTDGGGSWNTVQNIAFQNLNCIAFADDMHGAAGGNKSAILYTTDQGISWKTATVSITSQPAIHAIKFYEGLNGIAVGTSIILKTTDGGATWNKVAFSTNADLSSVYCEGSTFYTAGSKYCLKSTDEGNTWQNIMDTLFAVQNSFTIINSVAVDKSGFLWVAGSGGIMTNSPVTGINSDAFELISFRLEQNYPNPFNPSTNINFTINKGGPVTLKLFDILGREVKLIYKGEMSAGIHKFNFNAVNLASGTYIYSLQVNDQFTSRKMTLLK
jgi:photosystem II stability/assembly factor-like uncharacterized protein